MPAKSYAIRWAGVWEETAAPPGSVDHSGTPADFLPIPKQGEFTFTPDEIHHATGVVQQYKHGYPDDVLGPRSATFQMTCPLHGSGLAGDASTANGDFDDNALFRLLHLGFGGLRGNNQGSTVASAASASQFNVGAGHGARFTAGGAVGRVNNAGRLEICPIEAVSTDTITLKVGFAETPDVGNAIYNAVTVYLDDLGRYAQFLLEGAAADDYWCARGGALTQIGISNVLGQLPTLSMTWTCTEWARLGSGSLTGKTYANYRPFSYNGGMFFPQVVATATRALLAISDIQFQIALRHIPQADPHGTNTIGDWIQDHNPPVVTGSFAPFFGVATASTWYNAAANSTPYLIPLQIGIANSRGVLIEVPNAQLGPLGGPENANGLGVFRVPFKGRLDTDATDQTTAIRRSALKLHFVN